jgi:dimethylamine corrinoid protein
MRPRAIKDLGNLYDEDLFNMVAAVKVLEAVLPNGERQDTRGVIVIGTVEGDIHDIGKGIVATMLKVHGFEIHDLGRDVPIDQFVEKAKEVKADAVGSSAMMTTTQIGQKKLEVALREAGLRNRVITMVGGAVATDHWAKRIGADMWGESPQDAIEKLDKLLKSSSDNA